MKKLVITSAFSTLAIFGIAQEASPRVIANSGDSFSQSNAQISFTMGEPIIETQNSGTTILTQGFHQTQLQVTLFDQFGINTNNIELFPNPTQDQVNITFQNDAPISVSYTLYDDIGRVVHSDETFISSYEKMVYDLRDYVPGVYYIQLITDNGKTNKTYQIIKH